MIAEALKFLTDMGTKASTPIVLKNDPRNLCYSIYGEVHDLEIPISPRNHMVGSLEEVTELAKRFFGEGDAGRDCAPVVWYDNDRVILVLDDAGHRIETATLELEESDVFRAVVALREGKPWFDPKPFIRLLRIDLARTLEPAELLEKVRRVKFDNGMSVTSENRRDRESLGREITSKVEAGGEIPEEVTLLVPVYKTLGETDRLPIRCAVEVDPARGAFQLLPLPDEIERVRHLAIASIRDRLSELLPEGVPYYFGQP